MTSFGDLTDFPLNANWLDSVDFNTGTVAPKYSWKNQSGVTDPDGDGNITTFEVDGNGANEFDGIIFYQNLESGVYSRTSATSTLYFRVRNTCLCSPCSQGQYNCPSGSSPACQAVEFSVFFLTQSGGTTYKNEIAFQLMNRAASSSVYAPQWRYWDGSNWQPSTGGSCNVGTIIDGNWHKLDTYGFIDSSGNLHIGYLKVDGTQIFGDTVIIAASTT